MKQMAQERTPYYYGIGENVQGCKSLDQILDKSGLNWEVEKQKVYTEDNKRAGSWYATVRKDTGATLGIVRSGYQVVQNREGFNFIEDCLGEGIAFTKAGTFDNGMSVFMVGEAPTVKIAGDDVHPSILFTNSHDGGSSIKAMFTPMRIVCQNGLMIPIPGHEKGIVKVSIQHTKNVHDRLQIAKEILTKNNAYIEAVKQQAEELLNTPFTKEQYQQLSLELAGVEVGQEKLTRGQEKMVTDLAAAYEEEDVQNFDNTAWKAVLAVSDYDTHKVSDRDTGNDEYQFARVAYGMTVLAAAYQIMARMTGRGFRR